MADGWRPEAVADEVDFAVTIPSARKTIRERIYFIKVFFNLTKVMRFVERLVTLVVRVKMLLAVDNACQPFSVVIWSKAMG